MPDDETPEQARISELLLKNAMETIWAVYEARVKEIVELERKDFYANPTRPTARAIHVLNPPADEQMKIVGSGIIGGMMFERFEIQWEIGSALEMGQTLDGKPLTPEARAALAGVIGLIRSRGPVQRAKQWCETNYAPARESDWGAEIEGEIRANYPAAKTRRNDESMTDWRVARDDGPGAERADPGEAASELSVAGAADAEPAPAPVDGGMPVAGRPRRGAAGGARRARKRKP